MDFELLDDITKISESFISQFVMSWECFQIKQKDWIDMMDKAGYPIDNRWYNQAYMWDRMDPEFPRVTMQVAMAFLRKHQGNVMFMTEKGEKPYFQGKKSIDYVAKADAAWLADRIEQEEERHEKDYIHSIDCFIICFMLFIYGIGRKRF